MRLLFTLLLLIELTAITFAQYTPGARQISMANSDVALSNDVFSLFSNPAGLSQINWREVGIYYSPAPFGLTELSNGYIAYNEPFNFGSLSIGGMTYGFELYRESKVVLGYSYNYENILFAGISINYHNYSIQNYGSTGVFYLNVGGLVYILDELRWGFYVDNLNKASVANLDDQIPMVFVTGLSYDVINDFSLNFALEKDIRFNPSVKFGVEYDIIEYLSLRAGTSNEPSRFTAGVGINYSLFSLDYAFFTHQDLGLTHQAGIIISFGKEGSRSSAVRKNLNSR
ncbi:MAG: hypothetical protein HND39_16020 [Ignavibacteriota bacterium]|jgi:hypothetical protein|nr:hypothetical protein [Ignavibacteriales bacterium]MCC7095114.1 hypothetical protein [Ignavibacteriaceae bacterium]MEB2295753.1 hypothetical protein [Ignavibacteria bacterium]NUM60528.1 hypothetical protein [Ignavibacteriaceae bacterium]QKJ97658.1 MAG: hypothetical protein HND39_16020 [Ignavibacteriota bacterium]